MFGAYLSGMLMQIFVTAMAQDILGKDRYLKTIGETWINSPWWIWPIFMVLLVVADFWILYVEEAKCGLKT